MSQSGVQVRGQVVFEGEPSFADATVYVQLEDTSRIDAPSATVAEQTIRYVSYQLGQREPLRFTLEGIAPEKAAHYNVRVHVDVDNDGRIGPGDYLTMQTYPVLTHGHSADIEVTVRKIA